VANNFNDKIPGDTGLTAGAASNVQAAPAGLFDSLAAPFAFLGVLSRQDFWMRLGIGFIGFSLCILGIWIIIASDRGIRSAVTNIAGTAVKATPQGAATSAIVGAVS
jgi:hypothetical protein